MKYLELANFGERMETTPIHFLTDAMRYPGTWKSAEGGLPSLELLQILRFLCYLEELHQLEDTMSSQCMS